MNIEIVVGKLQIKINGVGMTSLFKQKIEQWFPSSYVFRVIRTSIVTKTNGRDYVSTESYDIIKVWDNQGKYLWMKLVTGNHELQLPESSGDGWTFFAYELQRRPSENNGARWKSLGYLQPNCTP